MKKILALIAAVLMSVAVLAQTPATTTKPKEPGVKQDMKDAGSSSKRAAKKGYHKTKRGVKKGVHSSAKGVRKGASKAERKTAPKTQTPPPQA